MLWSCTHKQDIAARIGALALVLLLIAVSVASAETVASLGDASIDHNITARSWTVSAGGASMVLTIDPAEDYALTSLMSPSGAQWLRSGGADSVVTVGTDRSSRTFGRRADGFAYASASARTNGVRLELAATFVLTRQNLSATRHIAVTSGSPTFEVWTTFQAAGGAVALANIDAFEAAILPGALNWLTGEQPAASNPTLDSEFGRRQQVLAVNQTLSFGSTARSSEGTVPWLAVDGSTDEFYTALMWSGNWSFSAARTPGGLSIDWSLGAMNTLVGPAPVDSPHVLLGVARGALPAAAAAMRTYVLQGLRGGRPIAPLVTYNTWYAYGTAIDEASMQDEMARAASMGVELFVIDAGWYVGADTRHTTDFTPGLGTWTVDTGRFPHGLAALAATAHGLGMKFGVWVEPERVDLDVVGQRGLDESWLAESAGDYQSSGSAMICLAGAAGRQWVVDHLTAFLDAVQPDYLKWDNNLWVNCDRQGHGHGATDGSFAHVNALYGILDQLRQRYPALQIENCSGGGNRLDFGMLRYTDAAWMSDQTAPSIRVRHNLEGLSLIFPPAYLLSFLTDLGWEPLDNSPDLPLYTRSRMMQVFGLSVRTGWLSDNDADAISRQIAFYKKLRPLVTAATMSALTAQANGDETQWDVVQETGTAGGIVIFAFNGAAAPTSTTVSPANLPPTAMYQVVSIDGGIRGVMSAADLAANGVQLTRTGATAAQILLFFPQR
jgi:alpha-galactosidase